MVGGLAAVAEFKHRDMDFGSVPDLDFSKALSLGQALSLGLYSSGNFDFLIPEGLSALQEAAEGAETKVRGLFRWRWLDGRKLTVSGSSVSFASSRGRDSLL
jgi:hypothetical protein